VPFLGYPFAKKGWTLYNLKKEEIFVSRDLKFIENVFPLSETNATFSDIVSTQVVVWRGGAL